MRTGMILTRRALDREVQDFYEFTVNVLDTDQPNLQDRAVVNVRVVDVNDHAPVFTVVVVPITNNNNINNNLYSFR